MWASVAYAAAALNATLPAALTADPSHLSWPLEQLFQQLEPRADQRDFAKFDRLVAKHYRTLNTFDQTRLYPGIQDLLQDLKNRGIRNVVVSLKPQAALDRIVANKGWQSLFTTVYGIDWFGPQATKTTAIRHILMDTHYPGPFLYIGDSGTDVSAARANGLMCLGVTYGDGDVAALRQQRPWQCVSTVAQLKAKLLGKEQENATGF